MTLIATRALSLTLSAPLFSDLTFTLAKGCRLGLVAANGRGKSSLLRLLAGADAPSGGEITRARGLRVALVAQDLAPALAPLTLRAAVAAALPDPDEDWRVDIALDDLAVPGDLRERPLGALSGGWQRMAMLARGWITDPDVLLLDEPTNHLDLARIGWLQRFLAALPRDMGLIVASHDRAFLDAVTTRTLFLREEASRDFALPYSRARDALDEADAADARRHANDLQKAAGLRRQAAKLKNIGINSGSDLLVVKTKQLAARADKLEQAARPAYQDRSAGAIRLDHSGSHARALVTFEEATISAPDGRALLRTGRLWINPGDRVVVLGPNGAGKTQLLRAVLAAIGGAPGAIRATPALRLGLSDQEMSQLSADRTPFDAVTRRFDSGDTRARGLLAGAGIAPEAQGAPIAALSGGQKARLAMLVLRLTRPNFFVLDEPTNHLDIEGQEALEGELQAEGISALLVSHDRSFVRAAGTRFWLVARGRIAEVDSPEDWFAQALAEE
ncbi:MAG: ABC-F family ATP-binding cassette domain-containing protein [Rhodobacterales bacterium]|nr:ABC-F family ATP-binding cassette domain-containing protein [Rhodobacterales bacterium]